MLLPSCESTPIWLISIFQSPAQMLTFKLLKVGIMSLPCEQIEMSVSIIFLLSCSHHSFDFFVISRRLAFQEVASPVSGTTMFRTNSWTWGKVKVKVTLSCLTLCSAMDCSLPGSSGHWILQARILEWVAIPFSRGSSQPRNRTGVSCVASGFFTSWATREAQEYWRR